MSFLFINKTLRLNNLKTRTAMTEKFSVFAICVETIIYLLLYDLPDFTYNNQYCSICRPSTSIIHQSIGLNASIFSWGILFYSRASFKKSRSVIFRLRCTFGIWVPWSGLFSGQWWGSINWSCLLSFKILRWAWLREL